jgi:hypothetical protein
MIDGAESRLFGSGNEFVVVPLDSSVQEEAGRSVCPEKDGKMDNEEFESSCKSAAL